MLNQKQIPSLDDLKRYYQEVYQPDQLIALIGLAEFRCREFGFRLTENKFIRNISFRSPSAIKTFMSTRVPIQASIGAVYDRPPTMDTSIQQLTWQSRELVFDIDLNEYDSVRTCGCAGADSYCYDCWSLINDAMLFLDDTMRTDFGYEQLVWLFSGRRGVHLWIFDETAKFLTQDARTAILNYLSMIQGEEYPFRIEPLPEYAKLFRTRLVEIITTSYVKYASIDELQSIGFEKTDAKRFQDRLEKQNFSMDSFTRNLPLDVEPMKLIQQAIRMRYPRIDRAVTIDTRHLLRAVGTVHSSTGKICTVIDDIANFSPEMAPSVWELLH